RRQALLVDQLSEIVDIGGGRIIAVRRPLAVAVAAQIGRQHMPIPAQGARDPIPIAAVVATTVDQQQGRRGGVTPIHIMQPQPLREIDPRGGAGACQIGSGHQESLEVNRNRCVYTNIARPPRAPKRQAGVKFAKSCFAPGADSGLNLGLCPWLPMPRGRQLGTARWCHVSATPSQFVIDNPNLAPSRQRFKHKISAATSAAPTLVFKDIVVWLSNSLV